MSGASLAEKKADECDDERARPWSRRSPQAFRLLAGARTAGAPFRTDVPIATFRCDAPAPAGGFADKRRIVAAKAAEQSSRTCGSADTTRLGRSSGRHRVKAPAVRSGSRIATFHCSAPSRYGTFVDERRVVADEAAACGRETHIRSPRALRRQDSGEFRRDAPVRCGVFVDQPPIRRPNIPGVAQHVTDAPCECWASG
jgi:hypothetical protein